MLEVEEVMSVLLLVVELVDVEVKLSEDVGLSPNAEKSICCLILVACCCCCLLRSSVSGQRLRLLTRLNSASRFRSTDCGMRDFENKSKLSAPDDGDINDCVVSPARLSTSENCLCRSSAEGVIVSRRLVV